MTSASAEAQNETQLIVDTETFADNFGLLAEAPNGMQKLRELILELAVQGKLVEQDSADEPASVLLESMQTKWEQLIEAGSIRKPKALSAISTSDVPFECPKGWHWARLGAMAEKLGAGSTPLGGKKVYVDNGIKFLRSQNVWNSGLVLDDVAHIPQETHDRMNGTVVTPGDILLNITGASIGRCAVVPDDFDEANVSQHVAIVRLLNKDLRRYVHLCMISPFVQGRIMAVQVGVSREGLSMSRLREFVLPVPPLAEQRRIVAKVDQLMVLCDELDAAQTRKRETRERLNNAALDCLLSAETPAEFAEHWQRICDHFDLLYDTPDTIAQLRQAILQLAVQGKLVPQDPNDEPASVLLDRIRAEKERLVEEGKIKKPRLLPPVVEDDVPFPIPSGWEWARLGHVTDARFSISYGVLVPGPDVDDGVPFVRVQDLSVNNPAKRPNKTIAHDVEAKYARTRLVGGEILLAVVGATIGKIGVAPSEWNGANIARAVCRIAPASELDRDFIVLVLLSDLVQEHYREVTRTLAQPTLNVADIEKTPIPLPPLAEQRRIVAKVHHLMSICDALEAKLTQAQSDSEKLMEATVHHLLNT